MGGSNSKNSIFVDYPKIYTDVPDEYDIAHVLNESNWRITVVGYRYDFIVKASRLFRPHQKKEIWYQLRVINKHHLKRERIRRGVATVYNYWSISTFYKRHDVCYEPRYNQYNFQVIGYAIIEDSGLRKLNFEDENVYGKSTTVLTTGGSLKVPIQTINIGAPLLAKYIDKKKTHPKLNISFCEEFFQVFHGVHVQLKVKETKALLNISANFQVLNVKRYCEHQLIWRDDFEFSEKQKFKMACKYDLNILMYQVLRNVKSVEELSKLASIAIKMNRLDTNISKLLIAEMYRIQ